MYFKMIANHPTYKQNNAGGDLSFTSCTGRVKTNLRTGFIAVGDTDGKPMPMTGW